MYRHGRQSRRLMTQPIDDRGEPSSAGTPTPVQGRRPELIRRDPTAPMAVPTLSPAEVQEIVDEGRRRFVASLPSRTPPGRPAHHFRCVRPARSRSVRDLLLLIGLGIVENPGFRQLTTWWRLKGTYDFLRGKGGWGAMTRKGFGTPPRSSAALSPVWTSSASKDACPRRPRPALPGVLRSPGLSVPGSRRSGRAAPRVPCGPPARA